MSEKKRKNFSSQFKAKVALEAIRGVKTVTEIAQAFGVHPTQVGQWKKVLQDQAAGIFEHLRVMNILGSGPYCWTFAQTPFKLFPWPDLSA